MRGHDAMQVNKSHHSAAALCNNNWQMPCNETTTCEVTTTAHLVCRMLITCRTLSSRLESGGAGWGHTKAPADYTTGLQRVSARVATLSCTTSCCSGCRLAGLSGFNPVTSAWVAGLAACPSSVSPSLAPRSPTRQGTPPYPLERSRDPEG